MKGEYIIDPDITKAETLPSSFYKDSDNFNEVKSKIFLKSWQWVGDSDLLKYKNSVHPLTILKDYLNEPIILTKDENEEIHCLTNICTHRGNILVFEPGKSKKITCMYHGRRFNNIGEFEFMPEFSDAQDFPRLCDNLHKFPMIKWGKLLFAGLNPIFNFQKVIDKMNERIDFLPIDKFNPDHSLSKNFTINAHWALYCDNYLEGFHIPFVHKGLNEVLDYNVYKTETYDYCNLQIGYSEDNKDVFDLPRNHIDFGKNVAAYYYWVFPNMMFNFYPWGLSINIVKPVNDSLTRVSFRSYVYDESKLNRGAGNQLQKVEEEDEFVVENVHNGLRSSFYKAGRFSPKREQGVHHFHRLISKFMNK